MLATSARTSPCSARVVRVGRSFEHDLTASISTPIDGGSCSESVPFRSLHAAAPPSILSTVTPEGIATGLLPMRDMRYQTSQSSSPPTFCSRASRSESTPREVEITATPSPLRTRGRSSLPT